ncbi:MAG: phosphoribosylaminoimidazolesuccinocarboxamide synthase [Patescibacteria group bacterium]
MPQKEGGAMLIETNLPNLLHRGKVRDTYLLPDGRLLMVATDRISAFDAVLSSGIPYKGLVLNRMSGFWFKKIWSVSETHFADFADAPHVQIIYRDNEVLANLPSEIASRAMIVRRAERIDIECIVRGYLAGSAWAEYRRNGTVWGQRLPQGLKEGEALPEPLFTPTTKAEVGHDQNMSYQQVEDMVGVELARQLEEKSLAIYSFAQDYAQRRGIILADTKMEFGLLNGKLILIDELLTPDSSRFWDAAGYEPGRSLPNFDKQYVRDWLDSQGWNHEPPAPELPKDVVEKTSQRYREAYFRLTGERIE